MPAGQVFALSKGIGDLSPATRREIERACVDTLAVLCAGWNEPIARALRETYPHVRAPWKIGNPSDAETTALTWGTAAARASIEAYPGSPAAPITDTELKDKLSDCIAMGAPNERDLAARFRSMAKQFAGNA
ncbi:hypothetical protein MPL1032_240275 [Mesorhizobium plurifarium]|uniref:Uncharacterized protein n=1 Tax=Mesorhizobium plurifarium TaxID=69974 RepID=A0A0K2W0T3_MESPL|nr:hypothetical protein MPL1032_240275 [Mesorhizobium plurifarium]